MLCALCSELRQVGLFLFGDISSVAFRIDEWTRVGLLHATRRGEPLRGILVWSFLNSVAASTGGTFVLAGSHRLMARFTTGRSAAGVEPAKVTRRAFYKSHPWLDALSTCEAPIEEFGGEADVDGLPARVLELTGEPGDVVLTHPLVLHTPAPNRGEAPRMMRIARLSRSA